MAIENYHIEAGNKSPEVILNHNTGEFTLVGRSIPENATLIYSPIVDWVSEYKKNPCEETNLHLDLEYFNTASSIWIVKIIKELTLINDLTKLVIVHLYFPLEDFEEMEEQDLLEIIAPFTEVLQSNTSVSLGLKVYGKDDSNVVKKEKLILF